MPVSHALVHQKRQYRLVFLRKSLRADEAAPSNSFATSLGVTRLVVSQTYLGRSAGAGLPNRSHPGWQYKGNGPKGRNGQPNE